MAKEVDLFARSRLLKNFVLMYICLLHRGQNLYLVPKSPLSALDSIAPYIELGQRGMTVNWSIL